MKKLGYAVLGLGIGMAHCEGAALIEQARIESGRAKGSARV